MFELVQKKYLELRNSEEGQTLAEYAILLALIAIIVIVAVVVLGTHDQQRLRNINTAADLGHLRSSAEWPKQRARLSSRPRRRSGSYLIRR